MKTLWTIKEEMKISYWHKLLKYLKGMKNIAMSKLMVGFSDYAKYKCNEINLSLSMIVYESFFIKF